MNFDDVELPLRYVVFYRVEATATNAHHGMFEQLFVIERD